MQVFYFCSIWWRGLTSSKAGGEGLQAPMLSFSISNEGEGLHAAIGAENFE